MRQKRSINPILYEMSSQCGSVGYKRDYHGLPALISVRVTADRVVIRSKNVKTGLYTVREHSIDNNMAGCLAAIRKDCIAEAKIKYKTIRQGLLANSLLELRYAKRVFDYIESLPTPTTLFEVNDRPKAKRIRL